MLCIIYDVFEENETIYAVIEYLESITLREYLLRNDNGNIPWDTARLMFMPVLTLLKIFIQTELFTAR